MSYLNPRPSSPRPYKLEPLAARQQKFATALDEIRKVLPNSEKQLITVEKKLGWYSKDQSPHAPAMPAAAVLPASAEEVAAVVRICARHKIPMTPRGAGTGVEGAAIPYAGGIVIDTCNVNTIRFDEENSCVWAGAGVKKLTLSKEAQKRGFLFGPDPASNPSVGGMVATSGSGMSTVRYGTTRENVIALRVVTPEGQLFQTRQVVRKSSAGLELTQLYIGSEGTLGIICEICFKLFPATKYSAGGYVTFKTTEDAVKAVVCMKQRGAPQTLLRCELMNGNNMESTNAYSKMSLPTTATVLLEFTGNDKWMRDIKRDFKVVEQAFRDAGKPTLMRYLKPGKEMDEYWSARRTCYPAAMRCRGKLERVFGTDVCVPLPKLAEIVKYTEDIFTEAGLKCYICAHISCGNFHINNPFTTEEERKILKGLEKKMIKRAIELGGTISGEHGLGVSKVEFAEQEHGSVHINIQERIKAALDKDNLMNPGAFYPVQQLLYPTANL